MTITIKNNNDNNPNNNNKNNNKNDDDKKNHYHHHNQAKANSKTYTKPITPLQQDPKQLKTK